MEKVENKKWSDLTTMEMFEEVNRLNDFLRPLTLGMLVPVDKPFGA